MAAAAVVPASRLAVSPRPSTELAAAADRAMRDDHANGAMVPASFVVVAGSPSELLEVLDALQGAGVTVPDGLDDGPREETG